MPEDNAETLVAEMTPLLKTAAARESSYASKVPDTVRALVAAGLVKAENAAAYQEKLASDPSKALDDLKKIAEGAPKKPVAVGKADAALTPREPSSEDVWNKTFG